MSSETFRVVRGNPTPEELAAALAVVRLRAAAGDGGGGSDARGTDEWAGPRRLLKRRLPQPGPSSWRTSYWPA
ncbi:acyl-CoA carboxylase subunit epsilon [Streptomyces polyrhachis]|uniref:Acyl-CoA carboxylase subunit epsilon n=1 Tax=Streptomyces polyrhachis TaxID=1282885 RepID=A0ABW2G9B3_9ACTN